MAGPHPERLPVGASSLDEGASLQGVQEANERVCMSMQEHLGWGTGVYVTEHSMGGITEWLYTLCRRTWGAGMTSVLWGTAWAA